MIEPTRELAVQVLRETRRLAGNGEGGWKVGVLGEEGCGVVKGSGKKGKKGKKGKGKGKEKEDAEGKEGEEIETEKNEEIEDAEEVEEGPEPVLGDIGTSLVLFLVHSPTASRGRLILNSLAQI